MSVLLEVVVDLLARTAVWLAAVCALAAAAAVPPWTAWGRGVVRWRSALIGAILGALALASLAHRFGLPDPGSFAVWRRPAYLVWTAGGGLAGSALTVVAARVRMRRAVADQ